MNPERWFDEESLVDNRLPRSRCNLPSNPRRSRSYYNNKNYQRYVREKSWFYYKDQPYKTLTLSGCRGYCKKQTNKRIRKLPVNFLISGKAGYRRYFDYWWTLF